MNYLKPCYRTVLVGGVSSSHQLSCAPLQGGLVHHVTFSEDLQYLAVCKGQEVIICNIQVRL